MYVSGFSRNISLSVPFSAWMSVSSGDAGPPGVSVVTGTEARPSPAGTQGSGRTWSKIDAGSGSGALRQRSAASS